MAPNTPSPHSQQKPLLSRNWVSDLWRNRGLVDQPANQDRDLVLGEPDGRRFDSGKGVVSSLTSLRIARAVGSFGSRFWKWFNRGPLSGERKSQWHWTQQGRGDLVDAIEKIHNASPLVEAQALSIDATGKHVHLYNLFVSEGTEVIAAIKDWAETVRTLGVQTVEAARVGIRGANGIISESAHARGSLEAIFPRPAIAGMSTDVVLPTPTRAAEPAVKKPPGEPGGGRQSQWHWTLHGRGDLVDTIENIHSASPLVEAQGLSIDATGNHVHLHRLFVTEGTGIAAAIEHWARAVKAMGVKTIEVARVGIRGPTEVIDESPHARAALEACFSKTNW